MQYGQPVFSSPPPFFLPHFILLVANLTLLLPLPTSCLVCQEKEVKPPANATLQVTGAVGWRREGLVYKKNEVQRVGGGGKGSGEEREREWVGEGWTVT